MTIAQKNYACDWCGCPIVKGAHYHAETVYGDDGIGTCRTHINCIQAARSIPIYDRNEAWEHAGHYQRGHTHEPNDTAHNCPGCEDRRQK